MNKRQIQRGDQTARIKQFVLDHPIEPPILRATTLLTEVDVLHGALLSHGSGQQGGNHTFRSGTSQRRALRKAILLTLSEISGTAGALDPVVHPGIRELFRLNNAAGSYQRLVNTGSAFLDHLEAPAVKALFTARGFAADFDTELTDQIIALAAAAGIKWQGRQTQKTGTVGLDYVTRRIPVVVRELSQIMVKHLRATDPLLEPVWKAAARAYVPAVTTPQAPPPGGSEGDGGSTPPAGS